MEQFIFMAAVSMPGFLLGIVFHEAAHAYMAYKFGDSTAKNLGRLSLNPAVHYDFIGTILFPAIGAMIGGVMFGWAKPVPVNPSNFNNVRYGMFWVSFAGPLANVLIAIISSFLYAIVVTQVPIEFSYFKTFTLILRQSILINLVLAAFNLIPFPPLDGSKMVSSFLDYNKARKFEELQKFSFIFIIILWTTNIFQILMKPVIGAGIGITNLFISILGQ